MFHFINGTFTEAYNTLLSDTVKELTTPEQLELIWNQITTQYGDFINITNIRTTQEKGYTIVYLTCEYTILGQLDTRVVFDSNKLIGGFQFVPTDISYQYQPPSYADTNNFTEENITIGIGTGWELPGKLTIPNGEGPFPAIVLVHGSGPNDMDETVGPNKPFKDIAWGLATKGIAVLRYEKRTKYYADTIITMIQNLTVDEETIDDALNAIEFLSNTEKIDTQRIYLLGHSLGGMLAPRIANQTLLLSGLIMLAAPSRSLEDLMLNQTIYLIEFDGNISEADTKQIQSVQENVTKIKTLNISIGEIVLGASFAYWQDLQNYDPIKTAEKLSLPLLILQGGRDYQVTIEDDFTNWQKALKEQPNVILVSHDSLNHLFINGSGPPTNAEYYKPGNVAREVIIDITNWIIQEQ